MKGNTEGEAFKHPKKIRRSNTVALRPPESVKVPTNVMVSGYMDIEAVDKIFDNRCKSLPD
jgi:hypothetical protein